MNISRENCAICNNELAYLYSLDNIPINLSCVDLHDIISYKFDKLSFSSCTGCNTIQLDKLVPLDILYSKSHNTTSVGKTWENYFTLFIENLQNIINDKIILEIGCPSGKIATKCNNYKKWYIVEPNKNNEIIFNDKISFIESFFDDHLNLGEKVDIIVHSHLFEHIYCPNDFLKTCYGMLNDDGEMIFGVPNMQYMVDKILFLGIFFEHTIFLNVDNITHLLKKNGFEIIKIIEYENHSTIYHTKKNNANTLELKNDFEITNYRDHFFRIITEYKSFIEKCNALINCNINKDIYIFGASYNTQTLLFFGLNNNIKGVLDNCKEKQNKYFYGTKLKIYSPEILSNNDNAIVILKNGYYTNEIFIQIQKINPNITIFTLEN
jgi:2-polyprenyl-3-methyl-5-hydroxy-6-metoxy-1,4-benzoquinol methylase